MTGCHALARVVFALVLLLPPTAAEARSCAPVRDRYVLACENGCHEGFRIADVQAFSYCRRRPEIQELDRTTAMLLARLMPPQSRGIYTVDLPVDWISTFDDHASASLSTRLEWVSGLGRALKGEDPINVAPEHLRELLTQVVGPRWLVRSPDGTTLAAVRSGFEREARREWLVDHAKRSGFWLSFLIACLVLVRSVHVYFLRLYRTDRARGSLLEPIVMQLLVGAAGVFAVWFEPFTFWPGTALVPAVVVLLPAQAWARLRRPRALASPCVDA